MKTKAPEEIASAQLWWFLPTLPSDYEQSLKQGLEQALAFVRESKGTDLTSINLNHRSELLPLIESTEVKRAFLSEYSTKDYLWSAQLSFDTWSESELIKLEQLSPNNTHSPLKYWVKLNIRQASELSYSCQLSPAELRLVTLIDPDLGRRIGDELDGQRPAES